MLENKILLGLNTTIIGMGIVFLVLILLSIVISIQSKLINLFGQTAATSTDESELPANTIAEIAKKGSTNGEATIEGADDETVALIMASVSEEADIPLAELKIKSIKLLN